MFAGGPDPGGAELSGGCLLCAGHLRYNGEVCRQFCLLFSKLFSYESGMCDEEITDPK